jgi:hypothetical protein
MPAIAALAACLLAVLTITAVRAAAPDGVVYFDEQYPVSWITRGAAAEMRDFAVALGFEPMGAESVRDWMQQAVVQGATGKLLIMASDVAPQTLVGGAPGADALFRKYLDAGGSVIWSGDVPFYFVGTGQWDKDKWDYLGGRGVLGIDTVGNWQGRSEARPAEIGKKWGLQSTWNSVRALPVKNVTQVLAVDADGNASAWTKEYKKGSPGFIRLWDSNITSFSGAMGQDLILAASQVLPRLKNQKLHGAIYLFRESDFWPLAHRSGNGLVREIQVSVLNVNPAESDVFTLEITRGGRSLETIKLFQGSRIYFRQNLDIPLMYSDQELVLSMERNGKREVLDQKQLAEPRFFGGFETAAEPAVNPVDLGRALIPNDRILLIPSQQLAVRFWGIFPGGGAGREQLLVRARAMNKPGETVLELKYEASINTGAVHENMLSAPGADIEPGKYRLVLTMEQGGEILYEEKRWLIVEDQKPAERDFGAFYTQLAYEGPVPLFDKENKKWSFADWDSLWERGPDRDIVVAFPNGNRFVWWRGSSNVPFWASAQNIGMTYEWLEAAWGRGGLVDCIEPLQDKEARFSRPFIVSSTPARAVIDWRYALIDMEYAIADQEWAEETYIFYPDGYGVRRAVGHFLPMTWHEANEFIVFIPAGINPFDVLPSAAVRIMSPDGKQKEVIEYPQPAGKWQENTPAVFRINWSKKDSNTPVMVSRNFQHFIVQYDGWKEDGRYVSPSYWGVHYPVTRGLPTCVQAPPGWRERPGHASLTAVETEPVRRRMISKTHELVEWAWLIGNTSAPDSEVLEAARSWIDPVAVEPWEGLLSASFDALERGYRLRSNGARTVKVKFTGDGTQTIFNPVFIVEDYPYTDVEITVNGQRPAVFQAGRESTYGRDTLVVWIGQSIPADAVVRIRAGEMDILQKITD